MRWDARFDISSTAKSRVKIDRGRICSWFYSVLLIRTDHSNIKSAAGGSTKTSSGNVTFGQMWIVNRRCGWSSGDGKFCWMAFSQLDFETSNICDNHRTLQKASLWLVCNITLCGAWHLSNRIPYFDTRVSNCLRREDSVLRLARDEQVSSFAAICLSN